MFIAHLACFVGNPATFCHLVLYLIVISRCVQTSYIAVLAITCCIDHNRYLKQRKLKSQLRKKGIRIDDVEGLDFEDLQGIRE